MDLLSGNEAIAQGAWEAGVRIAAAYPGTPSTETLECFAKKEGVYAEWCTNEKVALEVAIGASAAGARTLCTMKHVGLNVAADPLFTAAYTGVGGGLVLLAADDPGMFSSQNEQDSHWYGRASQVPVLDPADSEEALLFTKEAYEISERFDVPVILRSSVRISHTKCPVEIGERINQPLKPYHKDPRKWVMMPAFAKPRREIQLERIEALKAWVEDCALNRVEYRDSSVGVICSGAVYQHVREALPRASVFKLGVTWPFPEKSLRRFVEQVQNTYVIEEASEYLNEMVRAMGLSVSETPAPIQKFGELSPALIKKAFGLPVQASASVPADIPNRPPALCAGCPHRLVFKELSRMKAIVTGDIGCYTLGALPPLAAMDSTVDMGASVSMAHGFELALADSEHAPVVGIIGDSTFAHSGLSSLISTIYNQGGGTICILDNRTTAMTGRQGNPFNGVTLQGRQSRELDFETLLKAIGVEDLAIVNPHDASAVRRALRSAVDNPQLSVIVFRSPCVLLERKRNTPFEVSDECVSCKMCLSLACPALYFDRECNKVSIDALQCVGCGQCAQYCPAQAIVKVAENSSTGNKAI